MTDHAAMDVREQVAQAWHEGSDHAADGAPFGGPLCNCRQVSERMLPMLDSAWKAGYDKGEECYADAMNPDHVCFTSPYETEEGR